MFASIGYKAHCLIFRWFICTHVSHVEEDRLVSAHCWIPHFWLDFIALLEDDNDGKPFCGLSPSRSVITDKTMRSIPWLCLISPYWSIDCLYNPFPFVVTILFNDFYSWFLFAFYTQILTYQHLNLVPSLSEAVCICIFGKLHPFRIWKLQSYKIEPGESLRPEVMNNLRFTLTYIIISGCFDDSTRFWSPWLLLYPFCSYASWLLPCFWIVKLTIFTFCQLYRTSYGVSIQAPS